MHLSLFVGTERNAYLQVLGRYTLIKRNQTLVRFQSPKSHVCARCGIMGHHTHQCISALMSHGWLAAGEEALLLQVGPEGVCSCLRLFSAPPFPSCHGLISFHPSWPSVRPFLLQSWLAGAETRSQSKPLLFSALVSYLRFGFHSEITVWFEHSMILGLINSLNIFYIYSFNISSTSCCHFSTSFYNFLLKKFCEMVSLCCLYC